MQAVARFAIFDLLKREIVNPQRISQAMTTSFKSANILLLGALLISAAHAQTPPDAGVLQQQIERERQMQVPQRVAPVQPVAPAEMKPSGVVITVTQFRFAGNTLISSDKLAPVVAEFLNRPLDFSQLQAAAMAVANAYREAGWIVRAYLPQQDIQGGIVTIQIVEAVFGKLIPEGGSQRVDQSAVLSRFAAQQKSGEPLNADALDRSLLLADDLPGVTVAGSLRAGSREGETDLALKLADEPLIVGEVGLDNTGSRSTGSDRLTVNLGLNSPFGLGDQLSGNLIHSRGSDYLRLGYSLPVGADGWRVGINASQLDYKLVAAEFKALNAKGESTSVGLDASYPIIRSRLKNLFLNLAYDHKTFDNEANAATSSRYRVDNVTLGLVGNLFDQFGGGGANSASLALTRGDVELGTLDPSEDARIEGGFTKLRYSLTRQQVITPDLSLFAAYSGQWTNDDLDSSERFYLGGANGVRAYPANEGGGAKGRMLNLELRWKLPEGFTATAFYDWGRVTQTLDDPVPPVPNTYSLKGHGLSLGWQAPFGLNLKATWARRDGSNPNPTATGRDQDGSLDRNRWWFTASLPF
jgi:hemolysin activation/secretion protein